MQSEQIQNEHEIIARVRAAKEDLDAADGLIRSYIPFIRKEVSKFLSRVCTEQDDEYSIALMAFHEAIRSYEKQKGSFLNFASLVIRSRLTDYQRKESKHKGSISLYADEDSDDELPLYERIPDKSDQYEESAGFEATKQEIGELTEVLRAFGVSLTDVAENSPKQARTLDACSRAVRYAVSNPHILDELLRTKKLPMASLVSGANVEKKTLERHRKYILAMLLIQTNGYEIIRGHIRHVLDIKGGVSV